MRRHLSVLAGSATLCVLAGCGPEAASGRPCTAIGSLVGVSLRIEPPLAARTAHAVMTVCDQGDCHASSVRLGAATTTRPQACSGGDSSGVCAGSAVPTGGQYGFDTVPGLSKRPVRVTVVLSDAAGHRILDQGLTATPKGLFPNGPHCGEGGPQAGVVAQNGRLREFS